jgi:hypothetical protein
MKGVGLALSCLVLLSGCLSMVEAFKLITKSRSFAGTGKLLIMPPRDAVHDGKAHPDGEGSGRQLQESLVREFRKASAYDVVAYEENERFNFTTDMNMEEAVAESKIMGADYCLIVSLGEFRDAWPMTARKDFVNLDMAVMFDLNSGKEVWSLRRPLSVYKTNPGSYHVIIDRIAEAIAESITAKSIAE